MTICVHGLGYIGLATASLFANNGHEVVGYDVDEDLRCSLRRGEPDVTEPDLRDFVRRALSEDFSVSAEPVTADYHLICVPTPYDHDADRADLSYVEQAGRTIVPLLRSGDTIVLESTVPPGTTRSTLAPLISRAGFEPGDTVELGYTPETVLPGNTIAELQTNDRIVGGVSRSSTRTIRDLYSAVSRGRIHEAPDATTAEFVKLVQNASRDVNIAFANALALLADDYGIDVRTSIELANNHPRVDILDPGPGVGGHCLPVDPLFLRERSDETDLVDAAREINDQMPDYVVSRLEGELGTFQDETIAVLGVSYKGNVGDTRNSPGLAIARRLDGAKTPPRSIADGGRQSPEIRLHDPHVSDATLDLDPLDEALAGADAVLFTAAHDEFEQLDPGRVGELVAQRLVIDPLDLLDADQWADHGFDVVGL